jgi:site-specific DNA recombinase
VVLRSVTEPLDTATPMGKTIFAILAGMAEQER